MIPFTAFSFQGTEKRAAEAVRIVGADWGEGPPVPIPNTEVKLISAEDTCRVTDRENR